jgi:hypothetical protein
MKKNRITLIAFFAIVGIAFLIWKTKSTSSTIKGDLQDFAVEDTASIDKLFLADREGRTSLLERGEDGRWMLNGKNLARQETVANLLTTIKTLEIRSPVGKNLYNNTMKMLAAKSVKIEIYQRKSLVKTYYVGHPSMDNLGTFMYLEGSTVPYIMHIPGFNGFLTTRYFANPDEWRERGILRFDPRTIVSINVDDVKKNHKSFSLVRNPDSTFSVSFTKPVNAIQGVDILKIRRYLDGFNKTFYEFIDAKVATTIGDSITKAGPFARVNVTDDRNYTKTLLLYRKPADESSHYEFDPQTGLKYPFDQDKFYTRIDGDQGWYVCQYPHFDKILINPLNLLPGANKYPTQDRF